MRNDLDIHLINFKVKLKIHCLLEWNTWNVPSQVKRLYVWFLAHVFFALDLRGGKNLLWFFISEIMINRRHNYFQKGSYIVVQSKKKGHCINDVYVRIWTIFRLLYNKYVFDERALLLHAKYFGNKEFLSLFVWYK